MANWNNCHRDQGTRLEALCVDTVIKAGILVSAVIFREGFVLFSRVVRKLPAAALVFLSACGLVRCAPDPVDDATIQRLYAQKLSPHQEPLSVYFIGHSLVGRLMPALVAQFAPDGHSYESQSGWGAELQAHWEPDIPLSGEDIENDHPRFREAHEAIASGDYDVLVLTEKIDLEASIEYHDSWYYLAQWSAKAWASNPDTRVYVYETWHDTAVEDGWLNRIDGDLPRLWEREIIDRALAETNSERPIYVIPAGQVMARAVRDGLYTKEELLPDGIHMSTAANYLVALTHFAVIYGRSPIGLPHDGLVRETGEPFEGVSAEKARALQEIVWEVVTSYPRTGVASS